MIVACVTGVIMIWMLVEDGCYWRFSGGSGIRAGIVVDVIVVRVVEVFSEDVGIGRSSCDASSNAYSNGCNVVEWLMQELI